MLHYTPSRRCLCQFLAFAVCIALASPVVADEKQSGLRVEPAEATLKGSIDRLQLQVSLQEGDRVVDVTRSAVYTSLKPEICSVTPTGRVIPLSSGKGRIKVELSGKSVVVPVTVKVNKAAEKVSFREDVIPVISKAGCNQGACHASQYGKGGLVLSLFGYAPEQDHPQFVRDHQQRRVSLVRPEDSLILRKATMQIAHEGGKRFAIDSDEYTVLKTWIESGAPGPVKNEPGVVDLKVTPQQGVYKVDDEQQLRVVAVYADGRTRDVTNLSLFDSLGEGVAKVDGTGHVTVVGHGQAAVMIRFQGQAKVSHIISPFEREVNLAHFKPNNFIDEKVLARWEQIRLNPSPLCSDEEFVRRAFIDSIGTLPSKEVVEKFIASTDPQKREKLVDELLGLTGDPSRDIYVNEWSAYWALKWGDLIRNNRNEVGEGGMWALYNWMRQALRENMPVDQFVREIITAEGSIYQNGPANYYKIARKPDDLAETTAQVFLGVRVQCARCHHHPFEVYSQSDFYGLAAFFTRVGTKNTVDFGALGGDTVVKLNETGSIRHPRTNEVMQPTPLLGKPIDTKDVRDLRRPLADWLTSPENDLFSRNIVNRIWGYYMGTGIVEPIDDMRATNPASNPELLDALAADFVANKFDLRHLMRAIMTSRVYQLSSTALPENVTDTRFYTHYNLKRLPAEVLLDAVDTVTGTQEKFPGVPLGTRAIELPDPNFTSYFLDTLGRPQRVVACECERTADPNLAQVLQIANGDLMQRKLSDRKGRISELVKASDEEAIKELYLVAYSRQPTVEEIANCRSIIASAPNRREGLEDVLWAICNSREFLFNH